MRVIVVGCGRVGSELAVRLQLDGHAVAIIDKDANAFRRLPDGWGGQTVVGFGFDRDVLLEAGIQEANALAAVTSGDNSNILAARIARETFEIPHVVARIKSPSRAVIYQRLGIPTVATVSWTVDQVVRRLLPEEGVTAWTDPTGEINLVEHLLPESLCGHSYAELTDPEQFRPVLVTRGGQSRLVGPGHRRPGGRPGPLRGSHRRGGRADRRLAEAEASRGRRRRGDPAPDAGSGPRGRRVGVGGGRVGHRTRGSTVVKVGIAGGGVVGRSIARDLAHSGHEVVIIESDPAVVAREQGHEVDPNCRWFTGDACEVATLQSAGFGDADVVVAATGDDEDNLVVSLLAKQEFAVPRVIARVNHPKNQWLFNETWGVDVSVSTPHLMTALVEEAVSVGSLVRLLHFSEGKAGLVEVTLAEDSPARERQIAELGCRATPAWWPWCETGGWWCPGATPCSWPATR